eukprot:5081957-Lingulodinium_polyedra.AAC.1
MWSTTSTRRISQTRVAESLGLGPQSGATQAAGPDGLIAAKFAAAARAANDFLACAVPLSQ